MKTLRSTIITISTILAVIILSIIGFAGRNTVYSQYEIQRGSLPYITNTFLGFHDGIYPTAFFEDKPVLLVSDSNFGMKIKTAVDHKTASANGSIEDLTAGINEFSSRILAYINNLSSDSDTEHSVIPSGDFEDTVKEFTEVNKSYLDDALFIGDSRVVGLSEYSSLKNAQFYCFTGINVFKLFSKRFCKTPQGTTDLETALTNNSFKKIYLQVGINEIGTGNTEYYIEHYKEVVDKIRNLQPDALIFLQGIIRVSRQKENTTFSNKRINERNNAIKALADNKSVFYLEVNDALCDEEGYLKSDYSFDGVHLYAKYYYLWEDYILEHGIV